MNSKATVRKEYKIRLVLIAGMCLVWAFWCYKDATVGYPEQIKAYDTYMELQKDHPTDWQDKWNETANANGWKLNPTERAEKDIFTQWVMLWITLPIGLYFLIALVRTFGKWVAMDDNGLTTNSGAAADFASITELDKKLWDRKGIAFVIYKKGDGSEGRIKLDDWIFDRPAIRSMVEEIDGRLNPKSEGEGDQEEQPTEGSE